MKEKQWVCHISGQGEKWELSGKLYNQEDNKDWQVIAKNDPNPFNYHYIPKSEYRLCEPPEVWRDVTENCHTVEHLLYEQLDMTGKRDVASVMTGYRFCKVPVVHVDSIKSQSIAIPYSIQWAFIVEQKVSQ